MEEQSELTIENRGVTNTLQSMFKNALTADVYFLFGESDRIGAHRSVLAASSPVFQQMFYGKLKETADVKIVDASAEGFEEFLQLFYLEKCKLTSENVLDLIYLSHKYDFSRGLKACSILLEKKASTKTMCWIYDLAIKFEMADLRAFCEEEIMINTKTIFASESFKDCSEIALKSILTLEILACDEMQVFKSYMEWVDYNVLKENDDNKRQHLMSVCFELIRFPSMTLEDFTTCTRKCNGLLSSEEITDISNYIATLSPLTTQRFNKEARKGRKSCRKWPDKDILSCIRYSASPTTAYSYETFMWKGGVTFSSNVMLYLTGIETAPINEVGTYEYDENGCELRREKLQVVIEVYDSEEVLLQQTIELESGPGKVIEFWKPILVNTNDDYTIDLILGNECHHYYLRDEINDYNYKVELGYGIEINLYDNDSNSSMPDFSKTFDLISELLFERL